MPAIPLFVACGLTPVRGPRLQGMEPGQHILVSGKSKDGERVERPLTPVSLPWEVSALLGAWGSAKGQREGVGGV